MIDQEYGYTCESLRTAWEGGRCKLVAVVNRFEPLNIRYFLFSLLQKVF